MRVREEAHHLPASFLNSHEKIREEGLEAELSQLEQPHLATVVSTQYNCSIFKTAFTPSFVIATSTCFSYRNSRRGSNIPLLAIPPSPVHTHPLTDSFPERAALKPYRPFQRVVAQLSLAAIEHGS